MLPTSAVITKKPGRQRLCLLFSFPTPCRGSFLALGHVKLSLALQPCSLCSSPGCPSQELSVLISHHSNLESDLHYHAQCLLPQFSGCVQFLTLWFSWLLLHFPDNLSSCSSSSRGGMASPSCLLLCPQCLEENLVHCTCLTNAGEKVTKDWDMVWVDCFEEVKSWHMWDLSGAPRRHWMEWGLVTWQETGFVFCWVLCRKGRHRPMNPRNMKSADPDKGSLLCRWSNRSHCWLYFQ